MSSEKAVMRGFSIKPSQLEKLEKVVGIKRHGQFSQFIVDAITEKIDRIEQKEAHEQKKIAS